jgi:PIN domain nuclease of toxin-antitoxin system
VRVLIDTNVFLRLVTEPESVPAKQREAIDAASSRLLSIASAWEIAIKVSLRKLPPIGNVGDYVRSRAREMQASVLGIDLVHIGALQDLPLHHRDPFDRLIIAQALSENLALATTDGKLAPYGVQLV